MDSRENEEFTQFLQDAVRQSEKLGYRPTLFKQMLNADGGYKTVKRILESGKPSEGFTRLYELKRLDLTCEAVIVESRWRPFFDADLLSRAERLLTQSGYIFERFAPLKSDTEELPSATTVEGAQATEGNAQSPAIMSRKQFLESHGATCRNWTWSWSFVNEQERVVIFGVWDRNSSGKRDLILHEAWEISRRGRKQPGYAQALEHIRLVEEKGYALKTFPMIYSEVEDEEGVGPAKIERIVPVLSAKSLMRVGNCWYASDGKMGSTFPEEINSDQTYSEGAGKAVTVNSYERNPSARAKCLAHHGYSCVVCAFDFESVYGELGKNFIHVHHLVPLSEIGREYLVDPIKDLVPVCPNCHAMIHVTTPCLTIDQLKLHLKQNERIKSGA